MAARNLITNQNLYCRAMVIIHFLNTSLIKKFLNHYSNKLKLKRNKISNIMVKIRTLNSILIESSPPKLIDFLSLDVERMEIDVLKGVDFNCFNFKYLLIECSNQQKFKETNRFLIKRDDIHIDNLTDWDYLYEFKN